MQTKLNNDTDNLIKGFVAGEMTSDHTTAEGYDLVANYDEGEVKKISSYYENSVCPDCGEAIPENAEDGDECDNCGHAFVLDENENNKPYQAWEPFENWPDEDFAGQMSSMHLNATNMVTAILALESVQQGVLGDASTEMLIVELNKRENMVLKHEENGTDFILTGESCWISVNNLSVYIKKDEEGVAVDVYPKNNEADSESIGSTWVLYSEGEEDDEKKLEKFECMNCGCYFMVESRDGFCCPNCEDKSEAEKNDESEEEYCCTKCGRYFTDEDIDTFSPCACKVCAQDDDKQKPQSNYDLYAKEIQEMLKYAEAGDYTACDQGQDVWNEVLYSHTDIYPYGRSFDDYNAEWFEKNNSRFVDFLKQVIARETAKNTEV